MHASTAGACRALSSSSKPLHKCLSTRSMQRKPQALLARISQRSNSAALMQQHKQQQPRPHRPLLHSRMCVSFPSQSGSCAGSNPTAHPAPAASCTTTFLSARFIQLTAGWKINIIYGAGKQLVDNRWLNAGGRTKLGVKQTVQCARRLWSNNESQKMLE